MRTGNQIAYIFTDVIPAGIVFLSNEWTHILTDIGSFTGTFFMNLAGNIVKIVKNIPGLVNGSVNFGDLWTPLATGFKSTIEQLPVIADREKGELEKSLEQESDTLTDSFANGLGSHLSQQGQHAQDVTKTVTDKIKQMFKLPPVKAPAMPKMDAFKPKLDPSNLSLSITPEIKRADAVLLGSAQADAFKYGGNQLSTALTTGKHGSLIPPPSPLPTSTTIPTPPTPTPPSGMNDFVSWQKSQMVKDTDLLTKIEVNSRTPQFAPSTIFKDAVWHSSEYMNRDISQRQPQQRRNVQGLAIS